MASFDIMKATTEGYKFLWQQRALILRLAAIPVLIKFICLTTVVSLDLESNILRQGLVMFPAYLIEGYLICVLIRIAVYSHESIVQPPGSEAFEYYKQRGRDIQAGAVLYTLLKLLAALMLGLAVNGASIEREAVEQQPDPTIGGFLTAVLAFIFMIWAFRLIWINIPVTLGFSMRGYLKKVKGMSFSFHIFSVWVMCVIPFGLGIVLFSDVFAALAQHSAESPSNAYRIIMLGVQSVLETMMITVSSVAIAFGTYWVLTGQNTIQHNDRGQS